MPILQNPRHEAFAQARAKGALLDEAYEAAGFRLQRGHASRLAARPEVTERIAEIRSLFAEAEDCSLPFLIAALVKIGRSGLDSENPSVVREARLALVDAAGLRGHRDHVMSLERLSIMDANQ